MKKIVFAEHRDETIWNEIESSLNNVPFIDLKAKLYHFDGNTMNKIEDESLKEGGEAIVSVNIYRVNH